MVLWVVLCFAVFLAYVAVSDDTTAESEWSRRGRAIAAPYYLQVFEALATPASPQFHVTHVRLICRFWLHLSRS